MRRCDRPTVEDLDEYEEEEGEDEEEYEEEDLPKPTKDELEYLELRKRLKDRFRKKLKMEGSSSQSGIQDKRNKLPYDNFGSFFGPSQPVISQRVIQESKSLLETQHLASKTLNTHHKNKKPLPSAAAGPRSGVHDHQPKANEFKIQKIRDTRDYSFLFSDDAELPGPPKESRPQNTAVLDSVVHSSQASLKGKQSLSGSGRQFVGTREERKTASTNPPRQSKPGINNFTAANKSNSSAKKPNLVSVDSRKMSHINGNGPGRPVGPKGPPSKVIAAKMEKQPPVVGSKNSTMANVHKPTSSQMRTSMPKQQNHPRESQVSKMGNQHRQSQVPKLGVGAPKQPMTSSKPMIRKPSESFSSHKKKPVRKYSDDEDDVDDAFKMLRSLTGYNPNKFAGRDDDDSDMEADFETILREENRSSRIARQEDEEELQKIEEEERRERMRKLEKKRRMSQR